MRVFVVLVMLWCTGCALTFQDHLPSDYAGQTEPRCSTSNAWWIVDALVAVGDVALVGAEASSRNPDSLIIGTDVAEGLLSILSAAVGRGWVTECHEAQAAYDAAQLRERDEAEARRLRYELRQQEAGPARAGPRPSPPRGFFCAASATNPAVSTCARERADCEQARDDIATGAADIGACALVETAWCFRRQEAAAWSCAQGEAACAAQRDGVTDGQPGECVERR